MRDVIIGFVVAFGIAISLTLLLVIAYDLTALARGWETISEATLDLGRDHTAFAVLVTAELCAPVFLLLGHLLFGQVVKRAAVLRERERCALVARNHYLVPLRRPDGRPVGTDDHELVATRIAHCLLAGP